MSELDIPPGDERTAPERVSARARCTWTIYYERTGDQLHESWCFPLVTKTLNDRHDLLNGELYHNQIASKQACWCYHW